MAKETIYGPIEGVSEGDSFENRREMHDADLHRGLIQGIAPGGASIVLNEGYVDDEDHGDEIVYTGEGGRDRDTGRQVKDQELTKRNLALKNNKTNENPVRVSRGYKLRSGYAPSRGYRYDGLYRVTDCWSEKGRDGFKIWRFRLVKIPKNEVRSTKPSILDRLKRILE